MKYLFSFAVLLTLTLFACKDNPDRPDPILNENSSSTQPVNTATPVNSSTFNNDGSGGNAVYHYICPNGCGGGDAAGTCPTCGSAYTHNQAFHNQSQPAQTQGTANTATPNNPNITTSATPPTPEPAQNASGVWHYTCPNGCEGGGGSAIACASCGATLAHNSLYHQ